MKKNCQLTSRWMFETAIDDSSQDLRLEEEITESRAVNGHISSLHVLLLGFGDDLIGLFLILVVEKIVVVCHLGYMSFFRLCVCMECVIKAAKSRMRSSKSSGKFDTKAHFFSQAECATAAKLKVNFLLEVGEISR